MGSGGSFSPNRFAQTAAAKASWNQIHCPLLKKFFLINLASLPIGEIICYCQITFSYLCCTKILLARDSTLTSNENEIRFFESEEEGRCELRAYHLRQYRFIQFNFQHISMEPWSS